MIATYYMGYININYTLLELCSPFVLHSVGHWQVSARN